MEKLDKFTFQLLEERKFSLFVCFGNIFLAISDTDESSDKPEKKTDTEVYENSYEKSRTVSDLRTECKLTCKPYNKAELLKPSEK